MNLFGSSTWFINHWLNPIDRMEKVKNFKRYVILMFYFILALTMSIIPVFLLLYARNFITLISFAFCQFLFLMATIRLALHFNNSARRAFHSPNICHILIGKTLNNPRNILRPKFFFRVGLLIWIMSKYLMIPNSQSLVNLDRMEGNNKNSHQTISNSILTWRTLDEYTIVQSTITSAQNRLNK